MCVLLLSCSKDLMIKEVRFKYINNTGHIVELLTGNNGIYDKYAEIPDGESATFIFYGSDDYSTRKFLGAVQECIFYNTLKIRVEHEYIRVWEYHESRLIGYENPEWYGYDYRCSDKYNEGSRTQSTLSGNTLVTPYEWLSFSEIQNPCDGTKSSDYEDGIISNTYKSGYIQQTIILNEPYYLDTKLHYYCRHCFNGDLDDSPWVQSDGVYYYDETAFKNWEEATSGYQEYLMLSNKNFESDKEEALARMAAREH